MSGVFFPSGIIRQLEANINTFEGLLKSDSTEEILFRPEPAKWCLLEIACHLVDEETEDFRTRLKHVLTTPQNPLPPIDPSGWVSSRNYLGQNYQEKTKTFLLERKSSVHWLKSLIQPEWNNAYAHPKFGPLSGKLFLCNWLAHDLHHIRQIVSIKHAFLKYITGENLKYAGDWPS